MCLGILNGKDVGLEDSIIIGGEGPSSNLILNVKIPFSVSHISLLLAIGRHLYARQNSDIR